MALGRGLGLKVLLMTTHYSPLFAGSVCRSHFRYPQMRWNCPSNCSKCEVQVTWHSNSALSTHQVIILSFYHKLSLGATGVEHMTRMWWCYKGSTEEKRWKFHAFLSHAKDLTLGFSTICANEVPCHHCSLIFALHKSTHLTRPHNKERYLGEAWCWIRTPLVQVKPNEWNAV